MQIRAQFCVWGMSVHLWLPWIFQALVVISAIPVPPSTAILLNANPVNVKRVSYHPYRIVPKKKLPPFYDLISRSDDYYYESSDSAFSDVDSFPIEADDAMVGSKFSPPVIENHPETHSSVPFSHHSHREKLPPRLHSTSTTPRTPTFDYDRFHKSSANYPFTTGHRHTVVRPERESVIRETTVTSDYRVENGFLSDESAKDQPHLTKNNFTDRDESHLSVPSETFLVKLKASENVTMNNERHHNNKHRQNGSHFTPTTEVSTYSSQDNSTITPFIESETLLKSTYEVPTYLGTQASNISLPVFTTKATIDFSETNLTTSDTFDIKENMSDPLPPVESSRNQKLSSGALAGIIIAILSGVTVFTSAVIYLLYRRFNGKCTSVVESKFNSDNCGYLDDSLRSSVYLNNHIELPKENSEEMTSLDNDSFLNSLETMTIQNYWADSTKNTKV